MVGNPIQKDTQRERGNEKSTKKESTINPPGLKNKWKFIHNSSYNLVKAFCQYMCCSSLSSSADVAKSFLKIVCMCGCVQISFSAWLCAFSQSKNDNARYPSSTNRVHAIPKSFSTVHKLLGFLPAQHGLCHTPATPSSPTPLSFLHLPHL